MRCSAGYKKITGVYIGCVLIFLLLFPVVGHIGVTYCYAADPEQEQQKIKESILSEFEYGKIDDSLQSLFPEKRIIFKEVISEILTHLQSFFQNLSGSRCFICFRRAKRI